MTNRSGTSYCPDQHMSYHDAHALSDPENFVACSSGADPQGQSDSPTSFLVPRSWPTMGGPQHAVHRQHHQVFHLLRSHLGSPMETQIRHKRSCAFRSYVPGPSDEPTTLKPAVPGGHTSYPAWDCTTATSVISLGH